MDFAGLLTRYHNEIVATWTHRMLKDRTTRYADEPEDELRVLVDRATKAFRLALVENAWEELQEFVNFIARKRLEGSFTLAEVQRAFERYRETLIPLILAYVEPAHLPEVFLRLQHCMVATVTQFSTYFQDLHETFLRNQAHYLEREVANRSHELAESERKYKTLVEDINDGYFVLVEGTIAYSNNGFAGMHGYESREIIGMGYLNFVAPESRDSVRAAYEASRISLAGKARLEYLRLHRDGRCIPTEIMAKVSSYGGEVANIGVCRDLSERVELESKTREAEKLNALAQLAASLAHEINNPLTAIKMNVQMSGETGLTAKGQERLTASTLREVEQISRCVSDMMVLTIPFRLKYEWVDTRRLIPDCLHIVELRMAYQEVHATIRLSSEIKKLFVDPKRIEQALVNLILNSLDVLHRGGRIFISSRITVANGQRWNDIRVADDGPGIAKEKLPYVFDPFYSQKPGGIGLGLGNVRKIAEAHGGRVLVQQRRNRGIVFTLRLPRK
ncbi:MAG: ATP-binding protein [Deltaproteobacteria bacterium]|nr:ATP-binding protein [Deltaproteobacteria bacterium]